MMTALKNVFVLLSNYVSIAQHILLKKTPSKEDIWKIQHLKKGQQPQIGQFCLLI